jgi:hypothetical protein
MHRSRLAGFIVDCRTDDLAGAARFWGEALGMAIAGPDGASYVRLDASAHIETDDVEAEVRRLARLGARPVEQVNTWWVMVAPTGQRFCVVRAPRDLASVPGVTTWP